MNHDPVVVVIADLMDRLAFYLDELDCERNPESARFGSDEETLIAMGYFLNGYHTCLWDLINRLPHSYYGRVATEIMEKHFGKRITDIPGDRFEANEKIQRCPGGDCPVNENMENEG